MRRREFLTFLGGSAVVCPQITRAQSTQPVIGYLYTGAPEGNAVTETFRKGLAEAGYIEGRNVAVEYRFANNDTSRLPELAADLVRRRVAVIVAPGGATAVVAAKAATSTIPIVFATGVDPVQVGLVPNLNHPGGNVTGFSALLVELGAKQFGILHELLPRATRFGVLDNPTSANAGSFTRDVQEAAAKFGHEIEVHLAASNRELDSAFADSAKNRLGALLIAPNPLFANRRYQVVTLAAFHRLPIMYSSREMTEVGGLISYGANLSDSVRRIGSYVGRILKGEKPADLPVQLATKFEFVINLQTARTLGVEVPSTLLALADEVIE
jgi:putative ABC transport system substrate-binding protein